MPGSPPRRWRPRHLLAAWSAYWALLAVYTFGPAVRAFMRASANPHGKLGASAGLGDDELYLTITDASTTLWHGATHFYTAVLWVVVPPLLIWLLWLRLGPRRAASVARPRV